MTTPTSVRKCDPLVFRFTETSVPCTYWSDFIHTIVNGECRCGMKVVVAEVTA